MVFIFDKEGLSLRFFLDRKGVVGFCKEFDFVIEFDFELFKGLGFGEIEKI